MEMASPTHLFLLSSLCALLLLISTPTLTSANPNHPKISTPLIQTTCQQTPYKDLCLATLTSTTKASQAGLTGLAEISIDFAVRKATRVAGHITNLLNRYHPPTLQQCISDCSENYEDAAEQLNSAIGELRKREGYNNVVTWLSAAMTDVNTCEEGCNMQAVEKNVLTRWNAEFKNMCSNALAIVKLLPH